MNMSANSVVINLNGFKRFLINPSGHVLSAAVSYGGSSVRAAASFLGATAFTQRTIPAVPPAQDAGPNLVREGEMERMF